MKRGFWLLPLGFWLVAYVLPLDFRPLITPDEYRYAEIPREMIERGDWQNPRLLNVRYFEKPVLGYQQTILSFETFGFNRFAIRFPAALGVALAALAIWLLLQQATGDGKIAALGSTLYQTCGMVYGLGVFATLDSATAGFLTACLGAFYLGYREPRWTLRKWVFLLACGAFAGLAFLTKGFLAFAVPGLTVLAFLCWERNFKAFLTLPWVPLFALTAVALPWCVYIHRAEPDFWRYFIEIEHLQRFLDDAPGQHPAPFWLLFPVLLGGMFPAGILAPAAIAGFRGRVREFFGRSLCRFAACWLVLPFLFFSASSGKLATYVLPCFAPLSVLGAVGVAAYLRSGRATVWFDRMLQGLGWLLTAAAIPAAAVIFGVFAYLRLPLNPWLLGGTAMTVLIWGILLLWSGRFPARERLLLFFGGMLPVLVWGTLLIDADWFTGKAPESPLRRVAVRFPDRGQIVVTHPNLMHAVAYELKRPDLLVRGGSECEYGFQFSPGRYLLPTDFLAILNRSSRPAVLFIARGYDPCDILPGHPTPNVDYLDSGLRIVYFKEKR